MLLAALSFVAFNAQQTECFCTDVEIFFHAAEKENPLMLKEKVKLIKLEKTKPSETNRGGAENL